jgi:hypothetical protein
MEYLVHDIDLDAPFYKVRLVNANHVDPVVTGHGRHAQLLHSIVKIGCHEQCPAIHPNPFCAVFTRISGDCRVDPILSFSIPPSVGQSEIGGCFRQVEVFKNAPHSIVTRLGGLYF